MSSHIALVLLDVSKILEIIHRHAHLRLITTVYLFRRKEQNDIYAVPGQWVSTSALKTSSSPAPKDGPSWNGAQLEYMSSEIHRTFSSTDYENVPSNSAGFVTNDIYETCRTPATVEAGWVDNDIYGY